MNALGRFGFRIIVNFRMLYIRYKYCTYCKLESLYKYKEIGSHISHFNTATNSINCTLEFLLSFRGTEKHVSKWSEHILIRVHFSGMLNCI